MYIGSKWLKSGILLVSAALLAACGGSSGGGSGGGGNADADAELLARVERLFPFTPNQPFDVIFSCARSGSVLEYIFDLKTDGSFDLTITTDTGQDVFQAGAYTYQNDEIRLQTGAPPGAIIFNLDETTTQIVTAFGLVAAFQTPNMVCAAIGHRENPVEFGTTVHFDCPITNIQAVSSDENAIEFVLRTIPFNLPVPGSAFRQRDRNISGAIQPNIRRANGLYRRNGNDFYIVFAPNAFDDNNVLSGRFLNGDLSISVDQLEPGRGTCNQ